MHHATISSMLDPRQLLPERIRPLKRAEYDRLVDLGAFEDERIELLRGALVTMSPQKSPHAHAVEVLTEALVAALHGRARVRCQLPFAATDDSEPEPDFAVVPIADHRGGHPTTAHLIIEVSDSSLRKDRGIKRDVYAEAAVPEYWIVNVAERVIEVHHTPVDGLYQTHTLVSADGTLQPLAFPDVAIRAADLF